MIEMTETARQADVGTRVIATYSLLLIEIIS